MALVAKLASGPSFHRIQTTKFAAKENIGRLWTFPRPASAPLGISGAEAHPYFRFEDAARKRANHKALPCDDPRLHLHVSRNAPKGKNEGRKKGAGIGAGPELAQRTVSGAEDF